MLGGFQNIQEPAFILSTYAADGQFLWARKVEYNGAAQLAPQKVVRSTSGEFFVFGTLYSTANDYFITRIDPAGEVHWTRTYRQEQPGNDYGFSSIVATSDDQLVVSMGLIDRTVALRLDLDGEVLWSNRYMSDLNPTAKNPGFDFAATSDGGVLLTEKAYEDIYLVRLDTAGDVDWAKRYPNGGYCKTHIARQLSDGDFVIAGSRDTHPFAARISSSGQIVWMKEYAFDEGYIDHFDHVIELSEGDLLLTPSWNSSGIMALRITPLGLPLWARTIEGGGYAYVLGSYGDQVVLGGRTLLEIDGGFEQAILLLSTSESLDLDCLQGSTGATATDVQGEPPVFGCDILEETIIQDSTDMEVSAPVFGLRTFCSTAIVEENADTPFRSFPDPVLSGQDIHLVRSDERPFMELQRISADGLSYPLRAALVQGEWIVSTDGWASGIHLLRAKISDETPALVVRIVVL